MAGSNPNSPANATPVYQAAPSVVNRAAATAGLQVKTGAGAFLGLGVNSGAAGTVTLYDGTTTGGTKLGTINTATGGVFGLPCAFAVGLFIVQVGSADVTIGYR